MHIFGSHPIVVSCANTGQVLAVLLRPGSSGSNTVPVGDEASGGQFGSPRVRAVLAALLLHPTRWVHKTLLSRYIWVHQVTSTEPNLRSCATELGRVLELAVPGRSERLQTMRGSGNGGSFRLRATVPEVDMQLFVQLAKRGGAELRARDPRAATAPLGEAVALWRGRPGVDLPATHPFRERFQALSRRRSEAPVDLYEVWMLVDDPASVVPELEDLVCEEGVTERPVRLLTLPLCRSAERAAALAAYHAFRQRARRRDRHRPLQPDQRPVSSGPAPSRAGRRRHTGMSADHRAIASPDWSGGADTGQIRRAPAILSALGLVAALVGSGCGGEGPAAPPTATPAVTADSQLSQPEALLPVPSSPMTLDECPVTRGSVPTEPAPAALPVGPSEHWYGAGPLWADLPLLESAEDVGVPPERLTFRVRWKAFIDGDLRAQVNRLDADGQGRAEVFPAWAEGHAFWTGEVWIPTAGCWLVIAA